MVPMRSEVYKLTGFHTMVSPVVIVEGLISKVVWLFGYVQFIDF